jgi:hypothetical protein
MRQIAAALFTFMAAPSVHADSIAGKYVSRQKNICFVGPTNSSGEATWTDCSLTRDELKIRKNRSKYSVILSMYFANGHTCEFAGEGKRQNRVLSIIDDENPSCPLTLQFQDNTVQLNQADECRYNYCGARGAINGAIMFKQNAC